MVGNVDKQMNPCREVIAMANGTDSSKNEFVAKERTQPTRKDKCGSNRTDTIVSQEAMADKTAELVFYFFITQINKQEMNLILRRNVAKQKGFWPA